MSRLQRRSNKSLKNLFKGGRLSSGGELRQQSGSLPFQWLTVACINFSQQPFLASKIVPNEG